MTAHSLKTIKVKHKARFVGSKQHNSGNHIGFTDKEARGIFGSRYEYTEEELAYIEKVKKSREKYRRTTQKFYNKPAIDRDKQKPKEPLNTSAKPELQKQHDELKALGLNLVGIKQNDGTIIRFE